MDLFRVHTTASGARAAELEGQVAALLSVEQAASPGEDRWHRWSAPLDSRYVSLLESARTWSVGDDTLELSSAEGVLILGRTRD